MTTGADLDPATITPDHDVPPTTVDITHATVVMGAAATETFFGGHIDPAYARDVQGRRDVYLATGHILGYLDRHALGWAGPRSFLSRRGIRMRSSICAGDTITIRSTITDLRPGITGAVAPRVTEVDLETTIVNQLDELCVTAAITLQIPEETR